MTATQSNQPGVFGHALGVKAPLYVVATDGRSQTDAALHFASRLVPDPSSLLVVSVVDAVTPVTDMPDVFNADLQAARRTDLFTHVEAQLGRTVGRNTPAEMYDGDPAVIVTQVAMNRDADLIIAGIGAHDTKARLMGRETVLRIMRHAHTPVLAVSPDHAELPRRIMVAMDFSESGVKALKLALRVAAPGASVSLVHVVSPALSFGGLDETALVAARDALDALQSTIENPSNVTINSTVLRGDPSTELVAYERVFKPDLVAVGNHGRSLLARVFLGSTTTAMVRRASCSVLSVPRNARGVDVRPILSESAASPDSRKWIDLLDTVTRQNGGRACSIALEDILIGARMGAQDVPFVAATFLNDGGAVELTFGQTDRDQPHSRVLSGVTSIDVLQDSQQHDVALRISHGTGQTVLTFKSPADES